MWFWGSVLGERQLISGTRAQERARFGVGVRVGEAAFMSPPRWRSLMGFHRCSQHSTKSAALPR